MHMMLSKNYDPKKVKFPCRVSRKYDGVPIMFWMEDGVVKHATRQGNQTTSIDHIIQDVAFMFEGYPEGYLCCGEVCRDGLTFQEVNGKVRNSRPSPDLEINIFDCVKIPEVFLSWHVNFIIHDTCNNQEELQAHLDNLNPDWEGLIIRTGEYELNEGKEKPKRSWNSMKYVIDPSVDLRVLGFTEAISKDKEPKGMVGGILCEYQGRQIKSGPGKLSHDERKDIWENQDKYIGKIAQIQHKKDPGYKDLRQPTFQYWRDDKNETNEEI